MKNNNVDWLIIEEAKEHNLKNVTVKIPLRYLTAVTGISGSGKSSLVFDVLYQEGQRRFLEIYSPYTSTFAGEIKKPRVKHIHGLSPVIAIKQDSFSYSSRSTVGTFTDIYDLLRLLFARISKPVSPASGKPLQKLTADAITTKIAQQFHNHKISILAVMIRERKGIYRRQFIQWANAGFLQVRINNEWVPLDNPENIKLDKHKKHNIELLIDTLTISHKNIPRLARSVQTAISLSPYKAIIIKDWNSSSEQLFSTEYFCPETGIFLTTPDPNTFSFNSPAGWCPKCKGLGAILQINLEQIIDPDKPVSEGGIKPLRALRNKDIQLWVYNKLLELGIPPSKNAGEIPENVWEKIFYEECKALKELELEWHQEIFTLADLLFYMAEQTKIESARQWFRQFLKEETCPECKGTRLKQESLLFRINGLNIGELSLIPISRLYEWLIKLPNTLSAAEATIAKELVRELQVKTSAIVETGLGYLHLHRIIRTLSGGEAQRLRLASQIGSSLTGVIYILDEPTIGMHPAEIPRLIKVLKRLTNQNNTVIVVEHDLEVIRNADYIIELGPSGGKNGGKIICAGWYKEFIRCQHSLTAQYIQSTINVPIIKVSNTQADKDQYLILTGAKGNNLKNVTLKIPLGKFICVTGVSGSGKSSLILDTLYPALRNLLYNSKDQPLPYESISGHEHIRRVVAVDQEPIGKNPRSVPITYIQAFDYIRELFASLPEARARALTPSHFSFNTQQGACPECKGAGQLVIQMKLLPDVKVVCPKCKGTRYKPEVLEVHYHGKTIADVLQMTFEEATDLFKDHPQLYKKLKFVCSTGLGYLQLGQPSPTLSGGEAQRIKIARELAGSQSTSTLYILDEPTTGLHAHDVTLLLKTLKELVSKGNTVLVIEHNVDVIKNADWIIELGPGPADQGGHIIAEGTPLQIINNPQSNIGRFLKPLIETSGTPAPLKPVSLN